MQSEALRVAAEVVVGRADMQDLTALGMPKVEVEEVTAGCHKAPKL